MRWLEFLSGAVLGAVIVWAFLRRRRVLRETVRAAGLDDTAVERIIREGRLDVDDPGPLDLDEIERAEEAFWESEGWDPAEEEPL
ncbi:MAG: hypothetical protein RQ751_06940 [Longimicrobiales bacterium]|nr:hypothetical protein [Longimicrobiales bacterium]